MCSCTVKNPSQSAMDAWVLRSRQQRKPLVLAGCVPQGDKAVAHMEGVSVLGVQQIDRVVEVVEEALKGNQVKLLHRGKRMPALHLPKVRRAGPCALAMESEAWYCGRATRAPPLRTAASSFTSS